MTMATMQTSTALDDEEFVLIRDVPVFREHVAQLSDGRNVTFDREVLERIVENCNRRIAETGDYAAITVGHTKRPGEPGEQPPVVGFAGPFRVGELAGKTAIFADFRIFRDMADVLSRFPRRSAEFRLTPDIRDTWLDPIALLGGLPPKLDLGLTLLYAEENIERYAAVMPGDANTFVPELVNTKPSNNKETYSMEPNELVAKVLEAIKAEPWYQWISARMEAEAAKEKAEEKADDNPAPAEQNAESLPSEEADITPEKARQILRDGEVHGKPLTEAQRGFFGAIAGKDREKDSIDPASLARYQVELDELRRELEAERAKRVDTERAAVIRELRQHYDFDEAKEVERCRYSRMTDEQFADHVSLIRENYRVLPVGSRLPPLGSSVPNLHQPEATAQYSEDDWRRLRQYVLTERAAGKQITFEEALKTFKQTRN